MCNIVYSVVFPFYSNQLKAPTDAARSITSFLFYMVQQR